VCADSIAQKRSGIKKRSDLWRLKRSLIFISGKSQDSLDENRAEALEQHRSIDRPTEQCDRACDVEVLSAEITTRR